MTADLKTGIEQACQDLDSVYDAVAKTRSSGTLSEKSYSFFELFSGLQDQLEDAKGLLSVREVVLASARAYPTRVSTSTPDKFIYNNVEVTFRQGRFLLLQSYLATSWALYDSLSKVAGVLCCVDERAKDPSKPVKLPEDFLRGQKFVGARVHDHLKGAYGWPCAISYAVRNWLVHDGYSHDGIELFKYESPVAAPFEVSEDAWACILEKCKNEYKADDVQTRLRPFPEVQKDLLTGLESCHQEVDEAIRFLLLWSAGAAKLQASILFPRDTK